MPARLRVAVIGAGRWGKNIIRTIGEIPECELAYVVAPHTEGISLPSRVGVLPSASDLVGLDDIDAVIVATPPSTHAQIALPFIKRKLPVFIEKPVTTSLADAKLLQSAALRSRSLIFVGHIHLYNPAYVKARQLLRMLRVRLIIAEAFQNGPLHDDISALWDWAPHDIAVMLDAAGARPHSLSAWGISTMRPGTRLYDSSTLQLSFPKGVTGLMYNSWLMPEKRKRVTFVGQKDTLIFDDTAPRKLTLYKNIVPTTRKTKDGLSLTRNEGSASYPTYDDEMPLEEELREFFRCIREKKKPRSDIGQGVDVIRILEAAERSIRSGKPQKISYA